MSRTHGHRSDNTDLIKVSNLPFVLWLRWCFLTSLLLHKQDYGYLHWHIEVHVCSHFCTLLKHFVYVSMYIKWNVYSINGKFFLSCFWKCKSFFISVSLLQFPITTLPCAPSLSYPEPSVSHLSLCSVVISCCPHASPIERVYGLSISIYFSINPSSWSLNGTLHSALFQCCTDNSHTAHTQFITFMHPCGLMEWCTPKTQWPKTWVPLTEWLGMCVPHSLYCFFSSCEFETH